MYRFLLFTLTLPLAATPSFTNSGSASLTCQYNGTVFPPPQGPTQSYSATGTSIDLACPPSDPYIGPIVIGSSSGLSVTGNMEGAYVGFTQWSFNGQEINSETISGGTGQGTVTFTLDWTFTAENDLTAGNEALEPISGSTASRCGRGFKKATTTIRPFRIR